jgi:hypothetical protein
MVAKASAAQGARRVERVEPEPDLFTVGTRAARELQAALRAAGFVFPSLRGDTPWLVRGM